MSPIRIKRLAAELQMRCRRLNVYQRSQSWPGKDLAWRSELKGYDRLLLVAAGMVEIPAPELADGAAFAPEVRAALEDRLALAGLDVLAPRNATGDIIADGDLTL